MWNHCIQAEGRTSPEVLEDVWEAWSGRGELNWPCGVAIDTSDRVYVSEWNNHRVSVFTSEDQFLTSFGKKGAGPVEFRNPTGLTVDSSGILCVCDYYNDRVQFFCC